MKILILTSCYTGYGHASLTNAIVDTIKDKKDISYKVLEGLDLCNKFIRNNSKNYGKITRTNPKLWEILYKISNANPKFFDYIIKTSCKKKFLKEYNEFAPDIVLTLHPLFVGSILDIIKSTKEIKNNLLFVTMLADIIDINNLWIDKRSNLILCPSFESYQFVKSKGIPIENLKTIKLPTRSKITAVARNINLHNHLYKNTTSFFVMSGGEGSGNLIDITKTILNHSNTYATVITGRNKKLFDKMQELFKDNLRVSIHGFVDNIDTLLPMHDIAVVRGSPNVIMECVNLLVPIIITECLPGQEKNNGYYVKKYELGQYLGNNLSLNNAIENYLKDNKKLLYQTRLAQEKYRDLNSTKKIIATLQELYNNNR